MEQLQQVVQQPYAPAEPALNQIISEAGTIYGSRARSSRICCTYSTNFTRFAAQETMAGAANQQILDTIQGQYTIHSYLL